MTTTTSPTSPLLLTARETAAALRIGERSLWALTHPRGPIPCIRLGRSVRYTQEDLERWIREQATKQNQSEA